MASEIVEVKLTGMDGVLNMLRDLPAEVVSKRGGPVRKALRKGAVVIMKQWKTNLLQVTNNATKSGKKESTGLLIANLVVTRGKAPSDGNGERYLVRIKRKTYKDRKSGKPVTTLKTQQILEYGSEKQPAEPTIVPAFKAKAGQAVEVTNTALLTDIDRIADRLLRENGVPK